MIANATVKEFAQSTVIVMETLGATQETGGLSQMEFTLMAWHQILNWKKYLCYSSTLVRSLMKKKHYCLTFPQMVINLQSRSKDGQLLRDGSPLINIISLLRENA